MFWMLFRGCVAGAIVVLVSHIAERSPKLGALLLTLPVVSIVAFGFTWVEHHEIGTVARLARETLILVPLGLPFFVPLAMAERWGLSFWPAFVLGLLAASVCIGAWFWLTG
jgi:hypothetical protein